MTDENISQNDEPDIVITEADLAAANQIVVDETDLALSSANNAYEPDPQIPVAIDILPKQESFWEKMVNKLKPVLMMKKNDTPSESVDSERSERRKMPANWEINITFPEGFSMHKRNSFSEFSDWLENPIGGDPNATEHSIEGIVTPHNLAAAVDIKILTDRWYPQSVCPIQEDGTFSGSVWFHHSLPSATIRFDILDSDRKRLKRFDVNIS